MDAARIAYKKSESGFSLEGGKTLSESGGDFSFCPDGKFSGRNGGWAAVLRCPSCGTMFFASSAGECCPSCDFDRCEVYAFGTEGIPGWLGRSRESLVDMDALRARVSSLPPTDGMAEKVMSVAAMLSGIPRESALTKEKAAALSALSKAYPNMKEVLSYLRAALVRTKLRRSRAISFRPVLLVGGPGCGKSSFARELGIIVSGKDPLRVDLGNDVASFTLAGNDMSWRKSKCGLVLESMFGTAGEGPLRNPVVILDELDKMPESGTHEAEGVFYSILERETASRFRDNYFGVPVDASGINYIATANDVSSIPRPILSRFRVFDVRDYTEKEFIENVIPSFYGRWLGMEGIDRSRVPKVLSVEVRKLIFSESGTDTRKLPAALDRVLEKTGREDKSSGEFVAFFSKTELERGWRAFAGFESLPDEPFEITPPTPSSPADA